MISLRLSAPFAATVLLGLALTLQKDILTARMGFYIMAMTVAAAGVVSAALLRDLGHATGWCDLTSAILSNWLGT